MDDAFEEMAGYEAAPVLAGAPVAVLYPNLRHMRLLREAVRHGSLSRAAEIVHVSQPAASQGIARLSEIFGAALLDRAGQGVAPTVIGEIVNRRGERAIGHLDHAAQVLSRRDARHRESLGARIGGHVSLTQLRALGAFAESGSFSVAAQMLDLTEASVHRALRQMHKAIGVPVIEGSHRKMHLTPEGEILARGAALAIREFLAAHDEVSEYRGTFDGHVTIGALAMVRTDILPDAVVGLMRSYPRARIEIVDGTYESLVHQLSLGRIDCLIGALREQGELCKQFLSEGLLRDRLTVVARHGHPLAGRRGVPAEELRRYPWVLSRRGGPVRREFDRIDMQLGLSQSQVGYVESGSVMAVRGMLMRSDGLAILSRRQVRLELEAGQLEEIDAEGVDIHRQIGILTRSAWEPTTLQRRLIEELRRAAAV